MTDGTAEGGVISKKIKRIFQRVGEIIDENVVSKGGKKTGTNKLCSKSEFWEFHQQITNRSNVPWRNLEQVTMDRAWIPRDYRSVCIVKVIRPVTQLHHEKFQ